MVTQLGPGTAFQNWGPIGSPLSPLGTYIGSPNLGFGGGLDPLLSLGGLGSLMLSPQSAQPQQSSLLQSLMPILLLLLLDRGRSNRVADSLSQQRPRVIGRGRDNGNDGGGPGPVNGPQTPNNRGTGRTEVQVNQINLPSDVLDEIEANPQQTKDIIRREIEATLGTMDPMQIIPQITSTQILESHPPERRRQLHESLYDKVVTDYANDVRFRLQLDVPPFQGPMDLGS